MPYRATLGGGVGSDIRTAKIVVGNELAGDTASECDFLDPGDGSGITAALAALPASADLFIKAGLYDLSLGAIVGFTVPAGRRVWAAGPSTAGTRILDDPANGNGGIFIVSDGAELHDILIDVPPPTVANSGDGVVVAGKNSRLGNVTVDMNGASYVAANFTAQTLRRSFSFGIAGAGSEKTICQGCQATDLPRFYDEVGPGSEFGAYVTSDTPGSGLLPTKFIGCTSDGGDVGYWVDADASPGNNVPIVVQACSAVNVSTYGVYLQEADFGVVGEAVLSMANDDPNVASGVRVEALANATTGRHVISGVTAILTSSSGPTGNAIEIVTTIGTSAGTVVTGCNLQGDWDAGVVLGKSTTGNVVVGNAKASTLTSDTSDQGVGNEIGSGLSLFKWNELDVTQFGSNLITPTAGTISLSVVGGRIRMTLTGFQGVACFPITTLSLPDRFQFRLRTFGIAAVTGGDTMMIFPAHTNLSDASFFGLGYSRSGDTTSWALKNMEAGATANQVDRTGANITAATGIGGIIEVTFRREGDPISTPVDFTANERSWGSFFSAADAHGGGLADGADASYIYAAGWTGVSIPNFGIGYDAINVINGTVELNELEILKHPMEY